MKGNPNDSQRREPLFGKPRKHVIDPVRSAPLHEDPLRRQDLATNDFALDQACVYSFLIASLLAANRRLNTAYLLKESFGQLWDYEREGWARRFFESWKSSLKWQRLKPYEKFAATVERHWDGIASDCKPENKVPLGFVEGLNKIRVIQRRAYGLRDEEYLRLKILTFMLPRI
ncbi:ISBma1, transposase [Caballeronia choica]|jgi:Transposase|uniref:ISBma1, transposase n=1 Tax=Caballeronia choica TaxID=326476 RepID=A0A158K5Y8_9BURK|nr:transposase [Caballeronia choica]SAL76395.1 ISBma1, transposase [Caballeronia choica]